MSPEGAVGLGQGAAASVYDQPDAESVHARFDRALDTLTDKLPGMADHLGVGSRPGCSL
jgi:hypothetical protein